MTYEQFVEYLESNGWVRYDKYFFTRNDEKKTLSQLYHEWYDDNHSRSVFVF